MLVQRELFDSAFHKHAIRNKMEWEEKPAQYEVALYALDLFQLMDFALQILNAVQEVHDNGPGQV